MSQLQAVKTPSIRERVSPAEWQARVDLAAVYRLLVHFGWEDVIYTHCSARVPGEPSHFLLNPYGLMFPHVTASSLIKLDLDGRIVMESPYGMNPAGYTIHSAVLAARPDLTHVIHTHSVAGMAVSAQQDGLQFLVQKTIRFYGRLAYHDFEGVATNLDERQRLARDLGEHNAMILRNHGLLVCGRTVGEAFTGTYALEKSCEVQLAAQSAGAELIKLSPAILQHTADQFAEDFAGGYQLEWQGLLRLVDQLDPSYKT